MQQPTRYIAELGIVGTTRHELRTHSIARMIPAAAMNLPFPSFAPRYADIYKEITRAAATRPA